MVQHLALPASNRWRRIHSNYFKPWTLNPKLESQLVKSFSEEDLNGREPCPEKNFFLSNSPSFIEHRRWRLEMYINSLAHCPVVAHSQMFKEFLEYASNMGQYYEDSDSAYTRMTAYDREQERIKLEKLAALAKRT